MRIGRLLLVLPLAGCMTYTPLATPEPPAGTTVEATLTDSGSVALAQYLGPRVEAVRGRTLASVPDSLSLSVSAVRLRRGDESFWQGEPVTIPVSALAFVRERRVSWTRTGLLTGAVLSAIVLVSRGFLSGGSTPGTPPGTPPPGPQ